MVLGTASHVGKSVIATALCRILRQDGFRIAPFKAQNMSNNAAVTPDGGEIGRAQAAQAEAAGIDPTVEMNPILLKPEAEARSQLVVLGKPVGAFSARDYYAKRPQLWQVVTRSLDTLRSRYDIIVAEGAGSPAEVNLKSHDIVNMRVARYANALVLLVADIDRGGVFASIIGTLDLLEPEERALVSGLVVNKFRGDPSLFASGVEFLESRTGIPVIGVIPYLQDLRVAQEDSVALEHPVRRSADSAVLDIAVIALPRIANFDDADPLAREPGVSLRWVESAASLGSPHLIIIPGTKSTIADLDWLRDSGLADAICARARQGIAVIGICGGFQMLGQRILDPQHVESDASEATGLSLLPVETTFAAAKETHRVEGVVSYARGLLGHAEGASINGYEIHMGRTSGEGITSPFTIANRSGLAVQRPDGALDAQGWTLGTYIHGLFHNTRLRQAILRAIAARNNLDLPRPPPTPNPDAYDSLAAHIRAHLNMEAVYCALGIYPAQP
jgi:adenosylcobyric acid synthase